MWDIAVTALKWHDNCNICTACLYLSLRSYSHLTQEHPISKDHPFFSEDKGSYQKNSVPTVHLITRTREGRGSPQSTLLTHIHTTSSFTMPADFNGTWEMVSNDNFEDVMKALGMWFLLLNTYWNPVVISRSIYTPEMQIGFLYLHYLVLSGQSSP